LALRAARPTQEWLNFITTELHKNFGPMFSPVLADDAKAFFKGPVMAQVQYIDGRWPAAIPDGQQFHRRRRLSVHDAVPGPIG